MEDLKPQLNLFQNTTLIYAFLTFLGYSFIDYYYSKWGINIYSYLEASEVIFICLSNINTVLISICFYSFFYLTFILIPPNNRPVDNGQTKANRFKNNLLQIVLFLTLILIILGSFFYLYNLVLEYSLYVVFNVTLLFALYFYSHYKMEDTVNIFRLRFSKQIVKIALIIMLIYLLNNILSQYKFNQVNNKNNLTSFSFNYELNTYKSNDSLLFIGATSKYIFIRNTIRNTNLIFNKSNINFLSITEQPKK